MDRQQLKLCVPTCPLASAGIDFLKGPLSLEGSGVQSKDDNLGDQMHGRSTTKGMKRLTSGADRRRNVLTIGILVARSLVSLYRTGFPDDL